MRASPSGSSGPSEKRNPNPEVIHHQPRLPATCDGPPNYTYRVAYDEAGALLARLETHD